jgi:hypothetical protein
MEKKYSEIKFVSVNIDSIFNKLTGIKITGKGYTVQENYSAELKKRSAAMAAIQPLPAAVTACL